MTSIRTVFQITADISCLAVASYTPSPPKNFIKFVNNLSNCLADRQTSMPNTRNAAAVNMALTQCMNDNK